MRKGLVECDRLLSPAARLILSRKKRPLLLKELGTPSLRKEPTSDCGFMSKLKPLSPVEGRESRGVGPSRAGDSLGGGIKGPLPRTWASVRIGSGGGISVSMFARAWETAVRRRSSEPGSSGGKFAGQETRRGKQETQRRNRQSGR